MSEEDQGSNVAAAAYMAALAESVSDFVDAAWEGDDYDAILKVALILGSLSAAAKLAFSLKYAPEGLEEWTQTSAKGVIKETLEAISNDDFQKDIKEAHEHFTVRLPVDLKKVVH